MANNDAMQAIVIDWVTQRPRDETLAILDTFEVVAAAVNDSSDVVADPHFSERTLMDLANTVLGPALVPGPILHMDECERPTYDGVPAVGEHTREVLTELGLGRRRRRPRSPARRPEAGPPAGPATAICRGCALHRPERQPIITINLPIDPQP